MDIRILNSYKFEQDEKIECVLLVDDSLSTNFYNKKLIEIEGVAKEIYIVENGQEALDFIRHQGKFEYSNYPSPNIIFLDINMPKMGGFEFLDNYSELIKAKKTDTLLVFLTASNWFEDRAKAFGNELVHDYVEKPLTKESIQDISSFYSVHNE